jgi:hypothetical protein
MHYLFIFIITAFVYMSTVVADHKKFDLEFEEFLARDDLLMYQMNLWELFKQLEYTHGDHRKLVKEEITAMRETINKQIIKILELDFKHHKD